MTPENWIPLLQAMEPYPSLRNRLAEPGLTLEQRVALLRQAGFDVSAQELLQWRTARPEEGEEGGGDGGSGGGGGGGRGGPGGGARRAALSDTALDQLSGGLTLTFTNNGGAGQTVAVFNKPSATNYNELALAWQVLSNPGGR